MKIYLVSIGAGILVGVIYSLLNVRSPAPPLVALVGLLGILVGEQIIPVGKHMLAGSALVGACREARCASHLFGMLPGRHQDISPTTVPTEHALEKAP
jgi:XapX domain-containing protein